MQKEIVLRLVHQFIAVYIQTYLFISQILTEDLWFIIYIGQHSVATWMVVSTIKLIDADWGQQKCHSTTPADVNTFCEAMSSAELGHLGTLWQSVHFIPM